MNKAQIKSKLKQVAEELAHVEAWKRRLKRIEKRLTAALKKAS